MLEIVDHVQRHGVGLAQVADDDPLPGVGPHHDRDHQVAAVFADLAFVLPLGMLGPIVDQHVGRLRRAEVMVEELVVEVQRLELGARLGLLVAAIEKALVVLGPGGAGELGPLQFVGQLPAARDFQDVPGQPVAAGLRAAVGQVLAVVAEAHFTERNRAVFRPGVGVDQDPRPATQSTGYPPGAPGLQRFGHVQHGLVLQAVVLEVEVAAAFFHVGRVLGKVPKLGQAAADRLTLGDGGQVGLREPVLGLDPLGHLGRVANVAFQPAVGVFDLRAVVGIDVIDAAGRGIREMVFTGLRGGKEDCRREKKKHWMELGRRHRFSLAWWF